MYFEEMTPRQGSGSSARGRARVPLLPRKPGLLGEHLLAPAARIRARGCTITDSLQNKKNAGSEALQEGEISLSARVSFSNLLHAPSPIVSETRGRTKAAANQDSKLQGSPCREKAIPKSYLLLRRL